MLSYLDGWPWRERMFAHYNASSWQPASPGGTLTTTMYSIDMYSSSEGWAVGGASDASGIIGKGRWNGTSWQDVSPGINRILYAVDMYSPTEGWAVGQGGTTLHWDGAQWTLVPSPSGAVTLKSVSTFSATNAWAVGSTNAWTNNVWRWDGTQWNVVPTPDGAPLESVAMRAPNDALIGGDRGTIYHWDGTALTSSNSRWTTNGYYAVDFLAPNDGWAVGVLEPAAPGLRPATLGRRNLDAVCPAVLRHDDV